MIDESNVRGALSYILNNLGCHSEMSNFRVREISDSKGKKEIVLEYNRGNDFWLPVVGTKPFRSYSEMQAALWFAEDLLREIPVTREIINRGRTLHH